MSAPEQHEIRVGAIYDPRRRRWPEGAAFTHHDSWELLLRVATPTAREVAAAARGPASLAFFRRDCALLVLYRFGADVDAAGQPDPIEWSSVPLEPHLWKRLPPVEERAVLRIVLLSAEDGITRALRVVLLAPGFSQALRAAALDARAAYARDVAAAERRPCVELAAAAPYLTHLPRKASGEGPRA